VICAIFLRCEVPLPRGVDATTCGALADGDALLRRTAFTHRPGAFAPRHFAFYVSADDLFGTGPLLGQCTYLPIYQARCLSSAAYAVVLRAIFLRYEVLLILARLML
jgi:hypothetical protein